MSGSARQIQPRELPTARQTEDAAARAMARLLYGALDRLGTVTDVPLEEEMVLACRELLRGPLAEDGSREPGGYCMKAPTDPVLYELGRFGARLVELSYTVPDPLRAMDEAAELWARFWLAYRKEHPS